MSTPLAAYEALLRHGTAPSDIAFAGESAAGAAALRLWRTRQPRWPVIRPRLPSRVTRRARASWAGRGWVLGCFVYF